MRVVAVEPREAILRAIESQPRVGGRYTNLTRLDHNGGNGNFSLILTAEDSVTGKRVCLKMFNPLVTDPYREQCFERESSLLDELKGQRDILPIVEPRTSFEIPLETRGVPVPIPIRYFATELAESDLRKEIYSGASVQQRLAYFRGICRGLQRLASNGICHRDLKPENCFVGPNKRIWVGDMGVARKLDPNRPALRESYGFHWPGDIRYTAPELLCGIPDDGLFFHGDLFALGAILFEMFTKTLLTSHIYDQAFLADLRSNFALMPESHRDEVFRELVPTIASSRPLPRLSHVSHDVPARIQVRVERLYLRLCAIDFRKRPKNFDGVFAEIRRCEEVLRNEAIYQRLDRKRKAKPRWKR